MDIWTRLQTAFEEMYIANGALKGAAMYARQDPGDPISHLYFTPAAFAIAPQLILSNGDIACERPPEEGTTALVHNAADPNPFVD
jgi:hypothetical protein